MEILTTSMTTYKTTLTEQQANKLANLLKQAGISGRINKKTTVYYQADKQQKKTADELIKYVKLTNR